MQQAGDAGLPAMHEPDAHNHTPAHSATQLHKLNENHDENKRTKRLQVTMIAPILVTAASTASLPDKL